MSLSGVIRNIAAGWAAYHRKGRVDKNDPTYVLVTKDFPDALRPHVSLRELRDLYARISSNRSEQHDAAQRTCRHREGEDCKDRVPEENSAHRCADKHGEYSRKAPLPARTVSVCQERICGEAGDCES
jgi:hypothetical protein